MGYFIRVSANFRLNTNFCRLLMSLLLLMLLLMKNDVAVSVDTGRLQDATHLDDSTWHSVYLRRKEQVIHVAVDNRTRYTSTS